MAVWFKGADLSTLPEVERCGGTFRANGKPGDALRILKEHGINLIRLRLWNDPYGPEGESYGAGTCDLDKVLEMARRVRKLGLEWMLDLHYSDFWADPGKQFPPKAWQKLDADGLERAVEDYTFSVLTVLREARLTPSIVAVGNELTNGLLWPYGKVPEYRNIARFISAGIRGAHRAAPAVKTMIHLDNGGNNALYRNWFDHYLAEGGADFDYIGLSYYPFWHGSMEELRGNVNDLALRYHKDMMIAETSTGFTLEDYAQYECLSADRRKGMAATRELAAAVPYEMSREGQCRFVKDLMTVMKEAPEGHGRGFVYWEPAWIPVPGSEWATGAALAYTGEKGPGGNEWANQALFDYEGNALPALDTIRDF